ncbi:MAG: hypothetical protein NC314_11955 [Roseburia sp.]|nr:hypothetical protein [Roseburia sp.]MCM1243546.1 hypothetical protein [Roseburia sp.]
MSSQNSMYGEIREQHQKTKDMSLKGKLSYFWYYYKIHTLVVITITAFIIMFVYQYVTNKDYAFYAAIVNADVSYAEGDRWDDEFAQYAGIDLDEYECYIDTSFMLAKNDTSQYSVSSTEKLLVMIQSGVIDVIVADTAVFEGYARNEMFADLSTLLPADLLEKYKDCLYYTDAAAFDSSDDDTFYSMDELPDPDTFIIDHHDPASMEQPVVVGICLPQDSKIMNSGCYDYLSASDTTYQGYPSEAVLGIPLSATRFETIFQFLTFLSE